MKSDIEIARSVNPMNIMDVAKKIGICEYIIPYGKDRKSTRLNSSHL